ncbi:hypothetical protein GGI35DRAFT_273334 [Trichoderma velutinum]
MESRSLVQVCHAASRQTLTAHSSPEPIAFAFIYLLLLGGNWPASATNTAFVSLGRSISRSQGSWGRELVINKGFQARSTRPVLAQTLCRRRNAGVPVQCSFLAQQQQRRLRGRAPAVGEAGRSDTAAHGPGKARRTYGKSGMTDGRPGQLLRARSAHFAVKIIVIGVAPCPGAGLPMA